jgi:membrane protein implicated in regulation of membrane protease activity
VTPRARGRLRVLPAGRRIPAHPYRDSALVYGGLSLVVIVVAALTGGSLAKSLFVAVAFFVVALSWSWTRWRRELREEARRKAVEQKMRGS